MARFPLGVASFDPLTDRVLIWTSVSGDGACRWEVGTDPAVNVAVASGEVAAAADTGIVTVDVTGLEPGTTYWYRFTAGDDASPVGRTRTLPGDGAERLRIGAACCARLGSSEFTVYGELASADLDLVLHVGDYIYEDTKSSSEGREPDPLHDCVTLEDYRRRHAQARRDPHLQTLHARHPMVVIWDDHDLADNAWRGGAQTHDEASQGPWADRMAAALRAHHEHLPKRLADPDDPSTAWRTLDAGNLVRFVCTETRAHRDKQAGLDGSLAADDLDRTILGPVQREWITDVVADPRPRWLLVLSGTVVSPLVIDSPQALDGVLPEKYAVVDGHATNTDQWDGYLEDRRRLVMALSARRAGSIIISGDIHSSWAIEGPVDEAGQAVAVELVCPPSATTPVGQLLPPGVGARLGPVITEEVPGVRWAEMDEQGFLTIELTNDEARAAWWWVEAGRRGSAHVGRRWTIPVDTPPRLVDPEPPRDEKESLASPLSALRSKRRRRILAVVSALLTLVGTAAAALRTRRRRS
ncbi:MAG: alkaline phosphatase D family protein [Acidimicrobiales bacterium]